MEGELQQRMYVTLHSLPAPYDQEMCCGHFDTRMVLLVAVITDITGKTGNFKPYPVFIKMLVSSLKRTSDSVSIDLLTYSDLEVLKAKRLRRSGHDVPLPANTVVNNKRYLILTYQGEFDKVHYPLPLPFEEHPDPADLKRTIVRLRGVIPDTSDVVVPLLNMNMELHPWQGTCITQPTACVSCRASPVGTRGHRRACSGE